MTGAWDPAISPPHSGVDPWWVIRYSQMPLRPRMSAYSAMKVPRWYLPPMDHFGFAIGAHRASGCIFFVAAVYAGVALAEGGFVTAAVGAWSYRFHQVILPSGSRKEPLPMYRYIGG